MIVAIEILVARNVIDFIMSIETKFIKVWMQEMC